MIEEISRQEEQLAERPGGMTHRKGSGNRVWLEGTCGMSDERQGCQPRARCFAHSAEEVGTWSWDAVQGCGRGSLPLPGLQ